VVPAFLGGEVVGVGRWAWGHSVSGPALAVLTRRTGTSTPLCQHIAWQPNLAATWLLSASNMALADGPSLWGLKHDPIPWGQLPPGPPHEPPPHAPAHWACCCVLGAGGSCILGAGGSCILGAGGSSNGEQAACLTCPCPWTACWPGPWTCSAPAARPEPVPAPASSAPSTRIPPFPLL
jgi:hypothetical protein